MDLEQLIKNLEKRYNYKPNKKYKLLEVNLYEAPNGGTLRSQRKTNPVRHIHLPKNPVEGTSIYDLRTKKEFIKYFEKEFPNLPSGKYTARTYKNSKPCYLFELTYENGSVKNWKKKSNGLNPSQHSSSYYMFPQYFRKRDKYNI